MPTAPTPSEPLDIRDIDPHGPEATAEVAALFALIAELADYERLPVSATPDSLLAALREASGRTSTALAWRDGRAIGYLCWYRTFSTFRAKERLFLEDLYVTPALRGRGHGKAMLAWLARRAVSEGLDHMQWQVLDWNTPAIDFYRALGAEITPTWLDCTLTGPALTALAGR